MDLSPLQLFRLHSSESIPKAPELSQHFSYWEFIAWYPLKHPLFLPQDLFFVHEFSVDLHFLFTEPPPVWIAYCRTETFALHLFTPRLIFTNSRSNPGRRNCRIPSHSFQFPTAISIHERSLALTVMLSNATVCLGKNINLLRTASVLLPAQSQR